MIALLNADAGRIPLADGSVHMCVTSPPYWGLRKYAGLDDGQLGLEPTPEQYVANMVAVFREVRRVLRSDGCAFVNLGDSYLDKQMVGIPWRVAFALQADGWWLRSDIIWAKPNPMPESVTDRPTKSHEYLFLLSKSARYFYDADAVREPHARPWDASNGGNLSPTGQHKRHDGFSERGGNYPLPNPAGRNRRTVWHIATAPYSGAHFATYPPALVEPCIKAGTSERGVCADCGAPWARVISGGKKGRDWNRAKKDRLTTGNNSRGRLDDDERLNTPKVTTGWRPTCAHDADPIPATVLDPFAGSGTTLMVARQLGRRAVGLDLSFPYLRDQARKRLELDALDAWGQGINGDGDVSDLPLFAEAP